MKNQTPQAPLVSIGTKMVLAGESLEVVGIAKDKVTVKTETGCALEIDPQRIEQSVVAQYMYETTEE